MVGSAVPIVVGVPLALLAVRVAAGEAVAASAVVLVVILATALGAGTEAVEVGARFMGPVGRVVGVVLSTALAATDGAGAATPGPPRPPVEVAARPPPTAGVAGAA